MRALVAILFRNHRHRASARTGHGMENGEREKLMRRNLEL